MPQIVVVNGTEYEFPDSMSDDQIRTRLKRETQPQPKLTTPDSMGTSALKSAGKTVAGAVTQPAMGLKDLADTVIHDPELLRGTGLEGLLPGGSLAVEAGKAIAGQSVQSLQNAAQPGITPIERISHLLSSVPLVGPAAQQMGMKLGVGSTFARPTGESMSPQDRATFGEGVGEVAGNAALLGAGKAASKIGSSLAQRPRSYGPDAGTYDTAIKEANAALGVKPKLLDVEGKVNPGVEALAQGIDLKAPTPEIISQINTKLDQLGMKKASILDRESVGIGDKLFEEQAGGDITFEVNKLLDEVVAKGTRLGDKKLVKRAQSMKDYVQDSRGKPLDDLSFQEADDLAHELWDLKEAYLGGKRNLPLARAVEREYGLLQEALPAEARPVNASIRNLLAARKAAEQKWKVERAAGPGKAPPIKDTATLRRVIRHTPSSVVPGPLKPAAYIAKLLERMLPGSE